MHSEITRNENYNHHDTNEVENIHLILLRMAHPQPNLAVGGLTGSGGALRSSAARQPST